MSDKITLTFPDGSTREFDRGVTGMDVAKDISEGLARVALAIGVDGEVRDLARPIENDASIRILTFDDDEGWETYWHSSAHLMAEALEALYPDVKFGIGPPIDNGFYYDVDLGDRTIGEKDLEKIEQKMKELAKRDVSYERREVSKQEAIAYFEEKGDEYKLELLEDLDDGTITFYEQGEFTDLCRGPHIPSTKRIKYSKILNVAGAYWRGDETRKQLTRLYGITFPKKSQLEEYLERLELAKERDHRKLGKELGLFTFSNKVGPGLPLWKPKGAILRETLVDFLKKEQLRRGYEPVVTPHIGKLDLFRTSGHYPYYKESQFPPMVLAGEEDSGEEEGYLLKPMNCPHHCEMYKFKPRSYKDLPVRYAEFGTVYRYEQSGELHGLTRVRGFTQDDAHIFCRPDQVKDEFKKVIDLVLFVFDSLGFEDFTAQISLRDPALKGGYIGDDEAWEKAERQIQEAAYEKNLKTITVTGEAAFYGPKLDFMVKDVLGRSWQLGTIQVDYNLPKRFELEYVGSDNKKHQPVMIHRAPFGSMERFIAILIEHCAGNFPLWLSPEQMIVLPISEKFGDYAREVKDILEAHDIASSIDERDEKIGRKIRDAEVSKIPFMLIVGEKEARKREVSVRQHGEGDLGTFSLDDFITFFAEARDQSMHLGEARKR